MSRSQFSISKIRSSLGPTLLLSCGFFALSVQAASPVLTAGETVTAERLETRGIFRFDSIFSSAVIYGLQDMRKVKGADQNLLELHRYRDLRSRGDRQFSDSKKTINRKSENCDSTIETFARKDCLNDLFNYIGTYGRLASEAKFLELSFNAVKMWDERRQALVITEFRPADVSRSECLENAVCGKVGEYGSGDYVLCYKFDPSPSKTFLAGPLPESEARQLSAQFGGINFLHTVAFFEVTRKPKMLENIQQCTKPGSTRNKLVAEGVIRPNTVTFGWEEQIGYVYSGFINEGSKASQTSSTGSDLQNIAPLRAAPLQSSAKEATPNAKKILIEVK